MRLKLNPLQLVIHKFFRLGFRHTVHCTLYTIRLAYDGMMEGEVTLNEHVHCIGNQMDNALTNFGFINCECLLYVSSYRLW